METRYIIYGLADPKTKEIRYVGKSSSGEARARAHGAAWAIRNEGHLPVTRWILKLRRNGLEPEILILEVAQSPEELSELEKHWIRLKKTEGRLLNLTDGGEGASGYRQSEETRRRRSMSSRGRVLSEQHRQKLKRGKKPRLRSWGGGPRPGAPTPRPVQDDLGNVFVSVGAAAIFYGVDRALIRRIVQGKQFSSRGRTFRYVE